MFSLNPCSIITAYLRQSWLIIWTCVYRPLLLKLSINVNHWSPESDFKSILESSFQMHKINVVQDNWYCFIPKAISSVMHTSKRHVLCVYSVIQLNLPMKTILGNRNSSPKHHVFTLFMRFYRFDLPIEPVLHTTCMKIISLDHV